jgi:hypothetical protein
LKIKEESENLKRLNATLIRYIQIEVKFSDSEILTNYKSLSTMRSLFSQTIKTKTIVKIYQATVDGFDVSIFH